MFRELKKIKRQDGCRDANEFLRNVFDSVCKLNNKMGLKLTEYEQDGGNYPYAVDHPLMYGERGLYSLFAASLIKNSEATISELSHKRKPATKRKDQNARVVFWSRYNGRDYIIELKRQAISPSYDYSNSRREKWEALKKQIDEAKRYDEDTNYLGILVLYLYSSSKCKKKLNKEYSIGEIRKDICNKSNFRPDYLGAWEPKEEWKIYATWGDGDKLLRYEKNHGVLFLTYSRLVGND